jgi:hypothetical protein
MGFRIRNVPLIVAGGLVLAACNGDGTGSDGEDYAGFLYTSTNNTAGNAIVALGRGSDGRVRELPGLPVRHRRQRRRGRRATSTRSGR